MAESCPSCQLRFERQPGQFIGGVTINTVVTFVLEFVVMVSWILLSWPEPDVTAGLAALLPVGLLFPVFFYPVSKTLWTAIDIAMRPLQPGEAYPSV